MLNVELFQPAAHQEDGARDKILKQMDRENALALSAGERLRWFYLQKVGHPELKRVTVQVKHLLEPDNDTKIVSVVGMPSIGKTTLAESLCELLADRNGNDVHASEIPLLYVRTPANGEKSLSWVGFYTAVLEAAQEMLLNKKRDALVVNGRLELIRGSRATLSELRGLIERMLRNRNVRYLVIDEVMHLLRTKQYEHVMDTLKSLADAHSTKLVLLGANDLAELMTNYGQVARRSEIVHYMPYPTSANPIEAPGAAFLGVKEVPDAQKPFVEQLRKLQGQWPCREVPDLVGIWPLFLDPCLGSIGLLKLALLRLAALQMQAKDERFNPAMLARCFKPKKQLKVILSEAEAIDGYLKEARYGDSPLGSKAKVIELYQQHLQRKAA
jgi:hypothetical protein